jgi:hypothetical protein
LGTDLFIGRVTVILDGGADRTGSMLREVRAERVHHSTRHRGTTEERVDRMILLSAEAMPCVTRDTWGGPACSGREVSAHWGSDTMNTLRKTIYEG